MMAFLPRIWKSFLLIGPGGMASLSGGSTCCLLVEAEAMSPWSARSPPQASTLGSGPPLAPQTPPQGAPGKPRCLSPWWPSDVPAPEGPTTSLCPGLDIIRSLQAWPGHCNSQKGCRNI